MGEEHRGMVVLVPRVNRGGRSYQLGTVIRIMKREFRLFLTHRLDPPLFHLHVIHLIHLTGSVHRIPFPRGLRVPPCPRRSCHPVQRPLLVSRAAGRCRDDGAKAMAHRHHRHHDHPHDGGSRHSYAGHALQVPRALLRARLRLFRDRKLGWVAILSQFVMGFIYLFIYLLRPSPFPIPFPPFQDKHAPMSVCQRVDDYGLAYREGVTGDDADGRRRHNKNM